MKHNHYHSYEVESTNSWNFVWVEEIIKSKLLEYFDTGLTPSRAKQELENEL